MIARMNERSTYNINHLPAHLQVLSGPSAEASSTKNPRRNLLCRCHRAQAAPFPPADASAPHRSDWISRFQSPPSCRLPPGTIALLSCHQRAERAGRQGAARPAASVHAGVASSSGLAPWLRAVRLHVPSAKSMGRPLQRGPLGSGEKAPDSTLTARGMGLLSSCPGDTSACMLFLTELYSPILRPVDEKARSHVASTPGRQSQ